MALKPPPMEHVVQFPQMWTIFWSWLVGIVMGIALMGWFRNRGVKGMIADVKNDVGAIKTKVNKIKTSVKTNVKNS
jgi:hypothetical protein